MASTSNEAFSDSTATSRFTGPKRKGHGLCLLKIVLRAHDVPILMRNVASLRARRRKSCTCEIYVVYLRYKIHVILPSPLIELMAEHP